MRCFLILILYFFVFQLCAQQGQKQLEFQCTIDKKKLVLGEKYYLPTQDDSVSVDVVRLYISDLKLLDKDEIVFVCKKKHILVDLENPETTRFDLEGFTGEYDGIKFKLGVDSLTNVSGAMSGDLDPMHGMYWTWQSGYINLKLEGQANKCPTRKGEFQFHLGGYQDQNLAMQEVNLKVSKTARRSIITFPIGDFFKKINLQEDYHVMSPGARAVKTSQLIASLFIINEGK